MPQLDISTYSAQIFWLLVLFFSLFILMHFFILPPIQKTLDNRDNYLKSIELNLESNNIKIDDLNTKSDQKLHKEKIEIDRRSNELRAKIVKSFTNKKISLSTHYKQMIRNDFSKIQNQFITMENDLTADFPELVDLIITRVTK